MCVLLSFRRLIRDGVVITHARRCFVPKELSWVIVDTRRWCLHAQENSSKVSVLE